MPQALHHQILRSAFPWAFPAFFLDKIEEAYNMDPPLAFHQKKIPFRSMCCLLSRVGPLGRVGHCPVATSTRIHGTMCHTPQRPKQNQYYDILQVAHASKERFFWMEGKSGKDPYCNLPLLYLRKKPGKPGKSAMKQGRNI